MEERLIPVRILVSDLLDGCLLLVTLGTVEWNGSEGLHEVEWPRVMQSSGANGRKGSNARREG